MELEAVLKVPAAHLVHTVAPALELNLPLGQLEQPWAALELYFPAAQLKQEVEPTLLVLPRAQLLQPFFPLLF